MATWYVIDRRSRSIINAIETETFERADATLAHFDDFQHLYVDRNPPQAMLERYEFWHNRP